MRKNNTGDRNPVKMAKEMVESGWDNKNDVKILYSITLTKRKNKKMLEKLNKI